MILFMHVLRGQEDEGYTDLVPQAQAILCYLVYIRHVPKKKTHVFYKRDVCSLFIFADMDDSFLLTSPLACRIIYQFP